MTIAAPRQTVGNTAKWWTLNGGLVVSNHRGGGESSMVITTLAWCPLVDQCRQWQGGKGRVVSRAARCETAMVAVASSGVQWAVESYTLMLYAYCFTRCHSRLTLRAVLFLSLPRSEGWPHHGRTFSIYLYPLSFWLTLPQRILSTTWCCLSRPCVVFLACVHLALFVRLIMYNCQQPHGGIHVHNQWATGPCAFEQNFLITSFSLS